VTTRSTARAYAFPRAQLHGPWPRSWWEREQQQHDAFLLAFHITAGRLCSSSSSSSSATVTAVASFSLPAATSCSEQPLAKSVQLFVRSPSQSAPLSVEVQTDATLADLSMHVAAALQVRHPAVARLQLLPSRMSFRHAARQLSGADARRCSDPELRDSLELLVEGIGDIHGGSNRGPTATSCAAASQARNSEDDIEEVNSGTDLAVIGTGVPILSNGSFLSLLPSLSLGTLLFVPLVLIIQRYPH
jgi:hypothetical protein